jgi:KTSC domain
VNPVEVQSTVIESVSFDPCKRTLWVRFRNGSLYSYFGVSTDTYTDLLNADSKGTFFNRHIRGSYSWTRLAI